MFPSEPVAKVFSGVEHIQENPRDTLAEVLANFKFPRPLQTIESAALAYQLLQQFKAALFYCTRTGEILVHSLTFPTLSNIHISCTGVARITVDRSHTHIAADWLTALGLTLKNHTTVNETKEASIFSAVVKNIIEGGQGCEDLFTAVDTWQQVCLHLCSLNHSTTEMADVLVNTLNVRSKQARAFRELGSELSKHKSFIRDNTNVLSSHSMNSGKCGQQPEEHRRRNGCMVSWKVATEGEAFAKWIEQWQRVNVEFRTQLAQKEKREGLVQTSRPNNPECGQSSLPYLKSRIYKLINSNQSRECDRQTEITNPLSTMYSKLVSNPLSMLKRGMHATYAHLIPVLSAQSSEEGVTPKKDVRIQSPKGSGR